MIVKVNTRTFPSNSAAVETLCKVLFNLPDDHDAEIMRGSKFLYILLFHSDDGENVAVSPWFTCEDASRSRIVLDLIPFSQDGVDLDYQLSVHIMEMFQSATAMDILRIWIQKIPSIDENKKMLNRLLWDVHYLKQILLGKCSARIVLQKLRPAVFHFVSKSICSWEDGDENPMLLGHDNKEYPLTYWVCDDVYRGGNGQCELADFVGARELLNKINEQKDAVELDMQMLPIGPAKQISILGCMPHLKSLNLQCCFLGNEGVQFLSRCLKSLAQLKILILSNNFITARGCTALRENLQYCLELQNFDISHNGIGDCGFDAICSSLAPGIQNLNISHCSITTVPISFNRLQFLTPLHLENDSLLHRKYGLLMDHLHIWAEITAALSQDELSIAKVYEFLDDVLEMVRTRFKGVDSSEKYLDLALVMLWVKSPSIQSCSEPTIRHLIAAAATRMPSLYTGVCFISSNRVYRDKDTMMMLPHGKVLGAYRNIEAAWRFDTNILYVIQCTSARDISRFASEFDVVMCQAQFSVVNVASKVIFGGKCITIVNLLQQQQQSCDEDATVPTKIMQVQSNQKALLQQELTKLNALVKKELDWNKSKSRILVAVSLKETASFVLSVRNDTKVSDVLKHVNLALNRDFVVATDSDATMEELGVHRCRVFSFTQGSSDRELNMKITNIEGDTPHLTERNLRLVEG